MNYQRFIKKTLPDFNVGKHFTGIRLYFLLNLQQLLYICATTPLLLRWSRGGAVKAAMVAAYTTFLNVNYGIRLVDTRRQLKSNFLIEIFSVLVSSLIVDQVFREERSGN